MDTRHLQSCVVTHIDMIGTKDTYDVETGRSSTRMQQFFDMAAAFSKSLNHHDHVYVWNDSAVLLASVGGKQSDWTSVMEEVERFMGETDSIQRCFAVSVAGQAFPPPNPPSGGVGASFTYLSFSSYAFANCFRIERELKTHQKRWYVDSRIKQRIRDAVIGEKSPVRMLPKFSQRNVHMYRKSPWIG